MEKEVVLRRPGSRASSRQGSMVLPPFDVEDLDPSTRFLYVPHTLTGLLIGE